MADELELSRPPVIETVLGVQFRRIPQLSEGTILSYWKSISEDWPTVNMAPHLEDQFEQFGQERNWLPPSLRLHPANHVRFQFKNHAFDRMIQVQDTRFIYNWLQGPDSNAYPSYKTLRPEFDEHLAGFERFLSSSGYGAYEANQWEVTYVNQLPRNETWEIPAHWSEILGTVLGPADGLNGFPWESFGGSWVFVIPPEQGRLHLEIKHGKIEARSNQESLIVKLTARGRVSRNDDQTLDSGLEAGHRAIVDTFRNLFSLDAMERWK